MSADLLSPVWAGTGPMPTRSPRAWETLIGQARRASLLSRLAQHHVDQGWMAAVPEGPRLQLLGALKLADRQRHEVRWEVDELARALVPLGQPVVLLKGAAYLMAGLPASRGRVFADVDVMVPRAHIDAAEAALFGAGWIGDERDPYNQRYYREWMHEIPPLRHVQRSTVIDLHHTIAPPTSRFRVDGARLLARVRPLHGHTGLFVLAPEDMVLHSATHLFQEGEFHHGLRDLLDLRDLLVGFSRAAGFWPVLFDRAEALRRAMLAILDDPATPSHALHPGWRSWNPASVRISSIPSSLICCSTICDPGTIQAVTFSAFFLPLIMEAKALKSSMRPLVQLPIKT